MPATSEIFLLTSSMSPLEHRNFISQSLALSTRKRPLYIVLFEAVLKTKSGTDVELEAHLAGYPQILSKLPWYKQHLEEKIVGYLNEIMVEKSSYLQLKQLISEALVLVDRRLLKLADKRLARAAKIADQYDDALAKIEIADIRRRMSRIAPLRRTDAFIKENSDTVDAELRKLNSTMVWGKVLLQLNKRMKDLENVKDIAVLRKEVEDIRVSIDNTPVEVCTFDARIYEVFLRFRIDELAGEFESAYAKAYENLMLYDEKPFVKQEPRYGYLNAVTNYLNMCLQTRRLDLMPDWLQKLENAPVYNLWDEADRFSYWISMKIVYHMNVWDFETASSMGSTLEKGLLYYGDKLKPVTVLSIVLNLLLSFLPVAKFSDARKWIHKTLEIAESLSVYTFYRFCIVYQFIIDYELGDYDLMESHYRSVKRSFRKKESLHPYEIQIIRSLMLMSKETYSDKKKHHLSALRLKLIEYRKQFGRKQPFGIIEFSWWVDNRLGLVGMPGQ